MSSAAARCGEGGAEERPGASQVIPEPLRVTESAPRAGVRRAGSTARKHRGSASFSASLAFPNFPSTPSVAAKLWPASIREQKLEASHR